MLEKLVQDDLCVLALLQLNNQANPGAVRLVSNVGHPGQPAVLDQSGDVGGEFRLCHLVGDFSDDDRFFFLGHFLEVSLRSQGEQPSTLAVGIEDAPAAANHTPGREVRALDHLKQILQLRLGIIEQQQQRVADFL